MIGIEWVDGRADSVTIGDRVEIKLDLPSLKRGLVRWAITARNGAHAGRVVAYAESATIVDVTPRVQASTQQAWMGRRRKPCAWLVGTLAHDGAVSHPRPGAVATDYMRRVSFDFHSGNPWFFYTDDGARFDSATAVVFSDGAYAI